jgi:hypothetical protein
MMTLELGETSSLKRKWLLRMERLLQEKTLNLFIRNRLGLGAKNFYVILI